MSTHAKFAPSDSDRWMSCEAAIAEFPSTGEDNKYTLEGTNAHSLFEECLREARDAQFYVGAKLFPKPPKELASEPSCSRVVSQEMADYIQTVLDYVTQRYNDYDEDPELWSEVRVAVHQECNGTLDVGMYWKKARLLEIIDLKYGKGVIVDPDCSQLKIYGNGLIQTRKLQGKVDKVMLTVAQPRGFSPEGPIRSVEYMDFTNDAIEILSRVVFLGDLYREGAKLDYGPSDKACQWCAGKNTCPGRDKLLFDKAQDMFEEITEDAVPTELTEKVKWLAANGAALIDEINHAKSLMLEHVLAKGPAHGFKAVAGSSNRVWKEDKAEIEAWLRSSLKLRLMDITTPKLNGIPAIEKIVKKLKPKRAEELREKIMKPQGAPKLVPEDAGGSPIIRNAESMFEEITDLPDGSDDEVLDFL